MDFVPDNQKKLRPFLEYKLDTGDCHGLTWKDRENGIFKFPWYHYKEVSDANKPIVFKIFLDWARLTNKDLLDEKGQLNYPAFKHNMRCALNKMKGDFEKLVDNSRNKEDPHIIYKFVSPTATQQSPTRNESQDNFNTNEDKFHDKYIPVVVHSLAAEHFNDLSCQFQSNMNGSHTAVVNGSQIVPQANWYDSQHFTDYLLSPQSSPQSYGKSLQNTEVNDSEWSQTNSSSYNANYADFAYPSDLESVDFTDLISPQNSNDLPMSGLSSLNTPETSLELGACAMPGNNTASSKYLMSIKVCYGQPPVTMMNQQVEENGCRLFFGVFPRTECDEGIFGPKGVTEIMLPIVEQCTAQIPEKQKYIIQNILKEMDRGFTLTFNEGGDILAQRFCRSRVFVCDANFDSKCLKRKSKDPLKVFDFQFFQSKLKDCQKSEKNSKPPPAHFYLTIGNDVNPAYPSGPMSKILINVCVTHLQAEIMLKKAKLLNWGKSDSMQPEDSLPDSMDELLDQYKSMNLF